LGKRVDAEATFSKLDLKHFSSTIHSLELS
jgi:hypothetical protein